MSRAVIVIGAGLAGLSAAVALSRTGHRVRLVEANGQAGGRCRSYHDARLGRRIDNGTHVVLSGNRAVSRYCTAIGSNDALSAGASRGFEFYDLDSGERFVVRPNAGIVPWWLLSGRRRVPGTTLGAALGLAPLVTARSGTVSQAIRASGPLWRRFVEPVLLAALNTAPDEAAASLAGAVLRGSVMRGGRAVRPQLAVPDLEAAFIAPALATLRSAGAEIGFGRRLAGLALDGERVSRLEWSDGDSEAVAGAHVILAVPAPIAARLVPGLTVPDAFRAIVNAVYSCPPPADAPAMLGLLGGLAQWVFAMPHQVAVTVSAADALCDEPREAIAARLWADAARALRMPAALPLWQVVKERRATFAATPEQEARRPRSATRWRNLHLAGDWTATGLPATIEGAIRSGETAARRVA